MNSRRLESLIDDLERLVCSGESLISGLSGRRVKGPIGELFGTMVYDWRPAWDLAKEIQGHFRDVRYPSREERESAWTRFNNIRNELSQRNNADRERLFEVSCAWRDYFLDELKYLHYSRATDAIVFFLPSTTVEQMKNAAARVKEIGQQLSEQKHQMLREHKDEVFLRIQEVRETHDDFWGEYRRQRERKQEEYKERMRSTLARVEGNIEANVERLEKALFAYEKSIANEEKLEVMLATAKGEDFSEKVAGWLSEAREKSASIRESIERLREWIDQDKARRSDIQRKLDD